MILAKTVYFFPAIFIIAFCFQAQTGLASLTLLSKSNTVFESEQIFLTPSAPQDFSSDTPQLAAPAQAFPRNFLDLLGFSWNGDDNENSATSFSPVLNLSAGRLMAFVVATSLFINEFDFVPDPKPMRLFRPPKFPFD